VLILRSLCNERVDRLKTLHIILRDHFVQFRAINRHNTYISHTSVWKGVRTVHWVTVHVHSCRNFAKLLDRSTWRPLQTKFMIQPNNTDGEPCNCRLTCSVAVFISKAYSLINQRRITTVLWTSQRYLDNRTVICILNKARPLICMSNGQFVVGSKPGVHPAVQFCPLADTVPTLYFAFSTFLLETNRISSRQNSKQLGCALGRSGERDAARLLIILGNSTFRAHCKLYHFQK
jgi:hypothetical protein